MGDHCPNKYKDVNPVEVLRSLGKGSLKKKGPEGPPPSKIRENIFFFYMGSVKCFNAKNFFSLFFRHKIQASGRVSTKKGICFR